jgi:hypothetical protein
MCERIFRGGDLEGGAPFTKDACYQRGYCKTFNFFRTILLKDDTDSMRAFLAGKMHVDDVALVRELMREGLVVGPTYVPAWYREMDFIDAMFTHSATMNRFDVQKVTAHYEGRDAALRDAALGKPLTPDVEQLPVPAAPKNPKVVAISERREKDKDRDRDDKRADEKPERAEKPEKAAAEKAAGEKSDKS